MRPSGKTDLGGIALLYGSLYVWIILPLFYFFVNFLCKYDYVNLLYGCIKALFLFPISSYMMQI